MRHLLFIPMMLSMVSFGNASTVCVVENTAAVRRSPSHYSLVRVEVPVHYPFSVLDSSNGFYRVADYRSRSGWVKQAAVVPSHCAVVTADWVNVRSAPGTSNPVLFKAREGVAFEVLRPVNDWVQVRHESGKTGWVYRKLLWGLEEETTSNGTAVLAAGGN